MLMCSHHQAVSVDVTPECSIAVWAPRSDAEAIPLVLAKCFGTTCYSLQQQPDLAEGREASYPLAAAASFVARDDLTMQRVRRLSERLPKATVQLSVAFVNEGTGCSVSRLTVVYRHGKEMHRFGDIGDESGALPSNWLERLAMAELESAFSCANARLHGDGWKAGFDEELHFQAYRALSGLLNDDERAACLNREAALRSKIDADVSEMARSSTC